MTGLPSASQTVAPATGPQYERIAGLYAETLKGREIMYCHEAIFDLGACGGYLRMEIHLLPHQDPPEVDSMITSLLVQEGHYNWLVGAVKKLAHCFVMPISKNQIRQVVKTVEMGAECLLAVNDHLPRLATSYERFSQFGERVHARLTEFDALVSHALRISEYASHLPNPHVLLDVDGNQWVSSSSDSCLNAIKLKLDADQAGGTLRYTIRDRRRTQGCRAERYMSRALGGQLPPWIRGRHLRN